MLSKSWSGWCEFIAQLFRYSFHLQKLNNLAKEFNSIHVLQLDVESEEHLKEVVKSVETILSGRGLNAIINNAAMLTVKFKLYIIYDWMFQSSGAEHKNPDRQILLQHMSVNIVAPICVSSVCIWFSTGEYFIITLGFLPIFVQGICGW